MIIKALKWQWKRRRVLLLILCTYLETELSVLFLKDWNLGSRSRPRCWPLSFSVFFRSFSQAELNPSRKWVLQYKKWSSSSVCNIPLLSSLSAWPKDFITAALSLITADMPFMSCRNVSGVELVPPSTGLTTREEGSWWCRPALWCSQCWQV